MYVEVKLDRRSFCRISRASASLQSFGSSISHARGGKERFMNAQLSVQAKERREGHSTVRTYLVTR